MTTDFIETAPEPEMDSTSLPRMFPAEAMPGYSGVARTAVSMTGDGVVTRAVDPADKAKAMAAIIDNPQTKMLQSKGLVGPLGNRQLKPSSQLNAATGRNENLATRHLESVHRVAPSSRRILGQARQPQAYTTLNVEAKKAEARRYAPAVKSIYAQLKALEGFSPTSSMRVNPAVLAATVALRRRYDPALRSAPAAAARISANPRGPAAGSRTNANPARPAARFGMSAGPSMGGRLVKNTFG